MLENNACKKRIKEKFGKQSTKCLNTVKGWTKAWEKMKASLKTA